MPDDSRLEISKPVDEAVVFMRQVNDAESENRQLALTDLQFSYGNQWPQQVINMRGNNRVILTINETNAYIKKVENAQRQQRPRGKASPVDNYADKKVAKIITGLGRHIEVQSDADNAYDIAFGFAVRMGWGYWRLRTDYIADDSFDQDIYIDPVDNPFTVYFDNNSCLPDGSDAEKCVITDLVPKTRFRHEYPDAKESSIAERGTGDSDPDWVTDQDIRLAEYYFVERKRAKLVMLTDGTVLWNDQMPMLKALLARAGIGIRGDRDSWKRVVKWRKQTAFDILEEKDLPGRWIPVVPMYWTNVVINSKRMKCGLVRDAIDPARMVNYWSTAMTESLALSTKAKWLIAEGQDEDLEKEFSNANTSNSSSLHYKPTTVDGILVPPPSRIQPEPPPSGIIEGAFMMNQALSRVMGVFDPAVRGGAQHKSDKTLNAEQNQSDTSNFNGFDNLLRSIKHSWRIQLSWMPTVYDTERVARIIGEDGRDEVVTLNERQPEIDENTGQPKVDEQGNAVHKVLNDIRVGNYDVVMDTGPGYDTKRQEAVAVMLELLGTPLGEQIAKLGGDLVIRDMDFAGSDTLADRMQAANPMGEIDEKSDIPPKVQMFIKGLQMQLQQAGQAIEQMQTELKYRTSIEQMRQDGATRRTLMQETGSAHDVEQRNLSLQHSVESKAVSAQNIAEIDGLVQLLIHHLDTKRLEKQIAAKDAQQEAKHSEVASAQTP